MADLKLTKNARFFKGVQEIKQDAEETLKQTNELARIINTTYQNGLIDGEQRARLFGNVRMMLIHFLFRQRMALREEITHNNPFMRRQP